RAAGADRWRGAASTVRSSSPLARLRSSWRQLDRPGEELARLLPDESADLASHLLAAEVGVREVDSAVDPRHSRLLRGGGEGRVGEDEVLMRRQPRLQPGAARRNAD